MQSGDAQQVTLLSFDPQLSPAKNIDLFFSHLETVDQGLADLLRANISKLLPLPSVAQERSSARTVFNQAIITALDKATQGTEAKDE